MNRVLLCAVALCCGVLCAQDKPGNVGPMPRQTGDTWVSLPPNELTPATIIHARMMGDESIDWSVTITGAPEAWKRGRTGKGVKVAVLDTGVDANHKDLKAAIVATKDFTKSPFGADDKVGHGTHCAGSIGARKNGWGIIGQAYECDLIIGKVLNDSGSGTTDWIAAGVDWAVDQGADVISLSLGGGAQEAALPKALRRAKAKGVLIIAAAGNDNHSSVSFPGAYPECFAISAIDAQKNLADFSNVGPEVRATGPGVKVRSCYPGAGDGLFADMSGTSMATPNIAGVAALWCQGDVEKLTRPERFDAWLKRNSDDLGQNGRSEEFGYGLPKAAALGDKPQPMPGPDTKLTVTLDDLKPEVAKRLRDAGFASWKWEAEVAPKAAPGGKATTVTHAQLLALTQVSKVKLYFQVDGAADGFRVDEQIPGLTPGVYEVSRDPLSLKFAPVK